MSRRIPDAVRDYASDALCLAAIVLSIGSFFYAMDVIL